MANPFVHVELATTDVDPTGAAFGLWESKEG